VLAFAGQNVSIASGNADGYARLARQAARLIDKDGKLAFEREALQQASRAVLIDVLSCRENRSDSGVVARVAGEAIGADNFLPNMGTEDFLSCLSRTALEDVCNGTPVLPRPRVKDTRAELVKHFADGRLVHPAALFAPAPDKVAAWTDRYAAADADEFDETSEASDDRDGEDTAAVAEDLAVDEGFEEPAGSYAVAAE
jgi:ParB family transcriptional regulator, chromosome partitioning protein